MFWQYGAIYNKSTIMQKTEQVLLGPYRSYLEFIEHCRGKDYGSELVLHRHHIVPTFIHTDPYYSQKVVLLSVEDHIEAHYLMSKCFDEGSYEQIGNLRAVKLLSKKSVKYKEDLEKIYQSQRGDSNPAKLPENRLKITQGLIKHFTENGNPRAAKSYEQIYGDRAEEERLKRKKATRTPEEYRRAAQKTAAKLRGRVSHNAQEVQYRGQTYRSYAQASRETGVSIYLIKQQIQNGKKSN
jgi:hypothetical protein